MKPSFDLNSMKEFGTEHMEKFAFGGVVLLLLLFAIRAVNTVGEGRPSFTPDELKDAARNARQYWENSSAQTYLADSGIEVRPYSVEALDIRNPVEEGPYRWDTILTPRFFGQRGGRDQPGLKPLEGIRATAGNGAVAAGGGGAGQALGRGVRGTRWVLVTGLLPIKSQFEAFELAFEDAEYRNPQTDIPTYVGYRVERAELSPTDEAGQLNWRPISLRRAFAWTRLWGGGSVSARDLIHRKFYPMQPTGVWPMVFPLPPLTNASWGPEVAHPPEIPLLADMPEEERRAFGMYAGQPRDYQEGEEGPEGQGLQPGSEVAVADDFEVVGPGGLTGPGGPRGFTGSGSYEDGGMEPDDGGSRGSFGPMGPSMPGPGSSYPGSLPFGAGSGPYGPGMRGRPGMTRQVEKPVEHQLFRFMDFDVEPGKRYRYRVKLVLANPNFKVNARFLTDASLGKSWYIESDWSDPTEVVAVPRDSRLLAGSIKPPPPGTPPEMEFVYESTAQVIAVTIRMEDGLEAAHEYKVARGQLANFEADLTEQQPGRGMPGPYGGYGPEEEDMGSASMRPDIMGSPAMPPPSQPLRRGAAEDEEAEKIEHATGMLLLDMAGGDRLHRTDRSLTEPGALLLLDPDGNLVVSGELEDEEEFLAFHVPEEEKRPRRQRRPPTGYMGDEEGSAAAEEGYGNFYDGIGSQPPGARRRGRPRRGGRRERDDGEM